MIKAVITDLDGTVLNHGPDGVSVPDSFKLAHKQLTNVMHIPVYPATGRSLHSAASVMKVAGVDQLVEMKPGVYNDGRLVFASNSRLPTTEMAFDWELAEATYEWLKGVSMTVLPGQWGFSVMARDGQMAFFDDGTFPYQDRLVAEWQEVSFRVKDLDEIRKVHGSEVLEFTLIGEPEALLQLHAHFDQSFPHLDKAAMKGIDGFWLNHISLLTHSKMAGVRELCRLLDLSEDEVLVIGDEYNDIEMLKHFKHSIAMGNGPENVKACASVIAPSIENDGWSTAVLEYITHHNAGTEEKKQELADLDTTETITTQA